MLLISVANKYVLFLRYFSSHTVHVCDATLYLARDQRHICAMAKMWMFLCHYIITLSPFYRIT